MAASGTSRKLFGFWGAKSQAIDSLQRAGGMLEMMKLSRADFSTAQGLLEEARTCLANKEYRSATLAAEKAERLAEIIEERFRSARKAISVLTSEISELEELGLDATQAKGSLETAKQRIRQGTIEDGCTIPNYLEARIIAEDASKQARALIIKAKETSDAIFTAQLALDALKEMEGPMEHATFEGRVVADLEASLQSSTEKLATGGLDESLALAREVEERANRLRVEYAGCATSLDSCMKMLKDLNAEKVLADRAVQLLDTGKALLAQGKVTEAHEALARAEKEALMVSNQYHKAVTSVEEAGLALSNLSKVRISDAEMEKRLTDARRAMADGKYLRAFDLAEECRRNVAKKLELYKRLGQSLKEMKAGVDGLREKGSAIADDVDEIVSRAEREFEVGEYVGCGKDLKIASMLMGTTGLVVKLPLYLLGEMS